MQDEQIVTLYWQRDESAIFCTEEKYGRYLNKIAYNVLANMQDSEECVNDTYFKAWNSMPPHRPHVLSTFLGKICRQDAIDIFRRKHREKRGGSEYPLCLEELDDCVTGRESVQESVELGLLAEAIATYLSSLSREMRTAFVERYYYMDSVNEIAEHHGISVSKVKSMLHRTRLGLRQHLEQEGFDL